MTIFLFVALAVFCCWLAYRLNLWKSLALTEEERYHEVLGQLSETIKEKLIAEDKHDSIQQFLASISTRPIYAALTASQIETIGKMIVAGTGKKEWLN